MQGSSSRQGTMLAKIFTEGKGNILASGVINTSDDIGPIQSVVDGSRAYEYFFFTLIQHIYLGVEQFTFKFFFLFLFLCR